MLKTVLTRLHDTDTLNRLLVGLGYLDVNSSQERVDAVHAEMRAELVAAGIDAPTPPIDDAKAPVDGMLPVDPKSQA